MKRIKRVFQSHSQLCHVWAQQIQTDGRASRMFFENTTDIYSYGHHYLAAKVHEVRGQKFALVRSDAYSVSTGGHLSYIRSSLRGLMPYFQAVDVRNPKNALKQLDAEAQQSITAALKRIKIENFQQIQRELSSIRGSFATANRLRKLIHGGREKHPTKKQLAEVSAHLKFRLKRYRELNTPEAIEKRNAERERRQAREAAREQEKLAMEIELFRAGRGTYSRLASLPYELLRVEGADVVTSRGARVPLAHAQRLYRLIKSGVDISRERVGHFQVSRVSATESDTLLTIGCHRILLSEADRILAPQLVTA